MKYSTLFNNTFNPTELQTQQLDQYAALLKEYNKVMNLTGIDEYEAVYLKHFYDSLLIKPLLDQLSVNNIADLGTGAGFPGMVLAIFYPNTPIYLIEPLTKRCNFLTIVKKTLKLNNVHIINERVETLDMRFDIIVSRAVANLNILAELSLPFVNVGGYLLALKGQNGVAELNQAKNAITLLGGKVETIDEQELVDHQGKRINLLIKKVKPTPSKYPRNFGQIKKKPLS